MAFLDKLTELAKNVSDKTVEVAKIVGDKTGDMIEIGKLNAQISSANGSIEDLKTRLGDHYWNLFLNGETLDEDALVLCNTIKDYTEEIENIRAELAKYKAAEDKKLVCASCGEENSADASFCKACGAKLVTEEEHECNCGHDHGECDCDHEHGECECGHDHAAPAVKTCTNCGEENPADNHFCEKCGTKL